MSYNWGPRYIVPSEALKTYSGRVLLREDLDEELMRKELAELGLRGPVIRILNPWYSRKKGGDTWTMVGQSDNKEDNFAVPWDTNGLENGSYEVMGLMHVFVKEGKEEKAIARQNVVEVTVKN